MFQGATITERLDYVFDHYGFYKPNLLGLAAKTRRGEDILTQAALVERFKNVVARTTKDSCGTRVAPALGGQ